ncbi:hypothetical protein H9L10_00170 [Phycicoccus endophyticus]|uniref:DNA modification methylase n=1 Tax=Phycicoccus endophyticus TaxID=1690220 RepID=A0A7G9R1W9_9MICO|nr:hypothetical protein [Phycicoccus endophyticus]NHI18604.1 hypothetical protein [Phycicoccus endophyticus]QNN49594.1 hypothetical protein H9L10_00170 [Phycicoccus endophyticus]
MTKRAASALRFAGIATAALLAAGCGVFSPAQTDYSYIPADGVDLTIPGLDLRNIAVVTDGEGEPGVLVGQAVNDSGDAVEVAFGLEGTTGATTSVPAYSGEALSSPTSTVDLGAVPAAPGSLVELTVQTREAGQNVVSVPVLAAEGYYAGLAPSASASPTPTAG